MGIHGDRNRVSINCETPPEVQRDEYEWWVELYIADDDLPLCFGIAAQFMVLTGGGEQEVRHQVREFGRILQTEQASTAAWNCQPNGVWLDPPVSADATLDNWAVLIERDPPIEAPHYGSAYISFAARDCDDAIARLRRFGEALCSAEIEVGVISREARLAHAEAHKAKPFGSEGV